jgi:hypothetical protein
MPPSYSWIVESKDDSLVKNTKTRRLRTTNDFKQKQNKKKENKREKPTSII